MEAATTLRAHGGAVRYWKHRDSGVRAVMCNDGMILVLERSRWRADPALRANDMRNDFWEPDTRPVLSAAISRTVRQARLR